MNKFRSSGSKNNSRNIAYKIIYQEQFCEWTVNSINANGATPLVFLYQYLY